MQRSLLASGVGVVLVLVACGPPPGQYVCPDGYTLDGALCLPDSEDADGDGVLNSDDNCPNEPNPDQADLDGDSFGDACDLDDDADGQPDLADNCPTVSNPDQADLDLDGAGDACDDDDDQDGIPDEEDLCPEVWDAAQADTDGDGEGNACDEDDDDDGIPDEFDNCPVFSNPHQADEDYDGIGDACWQDADGDGLPDGHDNCASQPNVDQTDTDLDGEGNACDADDDGDGILDPFDNCPQAANPDQEDLDKNTIGDVCEGDLDGDAVPDAEDNCPLNNNPEQFDFDGDGIGDLCDEDANGDGTPDLVTSVLPSNGLVGGGEAVQLRGSGFKLGATVTFAGVPAPSVLVAGPDRIITESPEGVAGFADVVVTNADGQTLTAYGGYEYLESARVEGVVKDSNLVPVANVVVDLTPSDGLPLQAVTDSTGSFTIEDVPAGARSLEFNPSNAGVPGGPTYPALKVPIDVVAGRVNVVGDGRPTFLPILDTTHIAQVDPSSSVTVLSSPTVLDPTYAGASLTITAGNVVDENGAPYSGEILISEVPANRTPISLEPAADPSYVITIQPSGLEFIEPAPVSLPNLDEFEPGTHVPLASMNHDTGVFEEVGVLQVNAAGDRLETVEGGVRTSSWHLPPPFGPPDPPSAPASSGGRRRGQRGKRGG
ncbi:MAG: thrombospondin type 3 repeat-containing protein [Myxococcota bacterium]|nr:thrombospondin type 3 repeat-containing protein [Myxococcota bacterium]